MLDKVYSRNGYKKNIQIYNTVWSQKTVKKKTESLVFQREHSLFL